MRFIGIGLFIGAILLFLIGFCLISSGKYHHNILKQRQGVWFLCLAVCAFLIGANWITIAEEEEMYSEIEENWDSYTFFLDGQVVSYETIDLEQYNVSFDENEKKVFLTKE